MPKGDVFNRSNLDDTNPAAFQRGSVLPEAPLKYFSLKQRGYGVSEDASRGEINIYKSLSEDGMRLLSAYADNQCMNESNEVVNNVRLTLDEECRNYKSSRPDGEGYAEFRVNRYRELYQEAVGSASNPRSSEIMGRYFSSSLQDVAASAVNDEYNMRSQDSLLRTEKSLGVIVNRVQLDPNQKSSLYSMYSDTVNTMHPILGEKFGAYQQDKLVIFEKGFVRGAIDKDPVRAKKYLSKPNEILSANEVHGLMLEADKQIYYRNAAFMQNERMQESRRKRLISDLKVEIESAIRFGGENPDRLIEEAVTDYKLTPIEAKRLKLSALEANAKRASIDVQERVIDSCKESGAVVPDNISKDVIEDKFFRDIEDENMELEGSGKPVLKSIDMHQRIKANPNVYKYSMSRYQTRIEQEMMSNDPDTCLSACVIASDADNTKALKGLSQEHRSFGVLFTEIASSNKKVASQLMEFRNDWFAPKEKGILEQRRREFKESPENMDVDKAFKGMLKESGVALDDYWFFSRIPGTVRQDLRDKMVGIVKLVNDKTGSLAMGRRAAAAYCKNRYTLTDISGEPEYMLNAPTVDSIGASVNDIRKSVATEVNDLLSRIKSSGDEYGGFIPIKSSPKDLFDKKTGEWKGINVKAFVNNEWVDRKVRLESASNVDRHLFNCYILPDENNHIVKEYLRDPGSMNMRAVLKVGK